VLRHAVGAERGQRHRLAGELAARRKSLGLMVTSWFVVDVMLGIG